MKTKKEIRARIKQLRVKRNEAKQFKGAEGFVSLQNGAIKALEWVLGYKRILQFWCLSCGILHNNIKCPRCGNEVVRDISKKAK